MAVSLVIRLLAAWVLVLGFLALPMGLEVGQVALSDMQQQMILGARLEQPGERTGVAVIPVCAGVVASPGLVDVAVGFGLPGQCAAWVRARLYQSDYLEAA